MVATRTGAISRQPTPPRKITESINTNPSQAEFQPADQNGKGDDEVRNPETSGSVDEEEQKDAEHNQDPNPPSYLFRGHTFYITQSIRGPRKQALAQLIRENGGEVVEFMRGGAVELVESSVISRTNEKNNWVASDFIYESVRDRELKNVFEYMTPQQAQAVQQVAFATPPQRIHRQKYTVEEDAAMLNYLKNVHDGQFNQAQTVPLRIWKQAEENQVTAHSSQSMHERFRKILCKKTESERRNIIKNARIERLKRGETLDESEEEIESRRARKRAKPNSSSTRINQLVDAMHQVEQCTTSFRQVKHEKVVDSATSATSNRRHEVANCNASTSNQRAGTRFSNVRSPISHVDEHQMDNSEMSRDGRSGEIFRGYWEQEVSNANKRQDLERFFTSSLNSTSAATMIHTTNASVLTKNIFANHVHTSTPKRSHVPQFRSSPRSTSCHVPDTQCEQVLIHATPEQADDVINRLEFTTAHDVNAICSALYYASGDVRVAKSFLMGQSPPQMWDPHDDHLLIDYMKPNITREEVRSAKERGAFDTMHINDRSVDLILRRIQFLA